MTVPTISVIIPTYERPTLLARCLDRLAPGAQTIAADRYEVIVSDDGRSDATETLVRTRYPWVRWMPGPRRGPASNRNAGARAARAPWLVFLDDDCIPDAGWLAGFLPAIDAGVGIAPGKVVCREPWRSPLDHAPVNETGHYIWSCNFLIARSAFDALGGFDERFPYAHFEDLDLQDRARQVPLRECFAAAAVVDHPPRRNAFGGALATTHYAAVLHGRLHGEPLAFLTLVRRIVSTRGRAILARPRPIDSVTLVASTVAELWHVVWHWAGWQERARLATTGSTDTA